MNEHAHTYCPRCGKSFECKAESVTQCDCYAIKLSARTMQYISEQYNGCLCVDCLVELQANYPQVSPVRDKNL